MSKEISKHNIAIGVLCIAFMAYALICSIVFQRNMALRWFLWERFRHRPSSAGENNDLELKRPREGPFPRHPPMIA
ncbi:hypothetical protein, partial [Adlercreutzia equolifaciens]|uniref:hypothetical protein n=1 Tax=Adlercreutzia equolifaciens TaxID=446660 RepID=UPI001F1C33BD